MTMTSGGTFQTALFRALIVALVSGCTSALGVYATTDDSKAVFIAFAGAFLGSGAIRGLLEGAVDSGRQKDGEVAKSDVQPGAGGTP